MWRVSSPRGRGNRCRRRFLYSVGYTGDLRRVVSAVAQRFPKLRLTALVTELKLSAKYVVKMVMAVY